MLYDTPNVVAIYYYVWKQKYIFHLEERLIGSSGIKTHDHTIVRQTRCHLSYHASIWIFAVPRKKNFVSPGPNWENLWKVKILDYFFFTSILKFLSLKLFYDVIDEKYH